MFKIALRYIKGYRKNTIMVVGGIAFSVMLMYSLIQMGDCIINKFREVATYGSPADFKVKNLDFEQANKVESAIKNNKLKNHIESYLKSSYFGTVNLNNGLSLAQLVGIQGDEEVFWQPHLSSGRMPRDNYEICVDKSFLNNLDNKYKVGDKISLEVNDSEGESKIIDFKIAGIMENKSKTAGDCYVLTTFTTAVDIIEKGDFNYPKKYTNIQVLVNKDEYDIDKIVQSSSEIQQLLGLEAKDYYKNYLKINDYKQEVYGDQGVFKSVGTVFKSISVIIAICMVIFVYNSININVIEKIKQYGAMRCIGLSKKQLSVMIIFEVIIYSVVGIGIGILFGNLLNLAIANKLISLIMISDYNVTISQNIMTYFFVIAIALIAIVISMVKILRVVSKLSPIEALNYSEANKYSYKNKKELIVKNKNSFINIVAKRNKNRNKSKSRTLLVTLTISSTLLLIILNTFLSIDINRSSGKESIANYEIFTETNSIKPEYITQRIIDNLITKDKIKKVYASRIFSEYRCNPVDGTIKNKDRNNIRLVIYNDDLFKKLIETHNSLKGLDYSNEKIAILSVPPKAKSTVKNVELTATSYLKENNINCKSEYTVDIDKTINEKAYISGQGESEYAFVYLIVDQKLAEELLGNKEDDFTSILVKAKKKDSDKIAFLKYYFSDKVTVQISDLSSGTKESDRQMLGIIILALYIVLATIFLSLLIINNTIKANIINRLKENGVLRALGMNKKDLIKIICRENMYIASNAVLISWVISLPINSHFYKIIKGYVGINFSVYFIVAIIILLISYVTAKLAINKCLKCRIIEMIREE